VNLDANSGRVKIEQPLLDVPPAPSTAEEQATQRADDNGWNQSGSSR
jgi:hypothetical protein